MSKSNVIILVSFLLIWFVASNYFENRKQLKRKCHSIAVFSEAYAIKYNEIKPKTEIEFSILDISVSIQKGFAKGMGTSYKVLDGLEKNIVKNNFRLENVGKRYFKYCMEHN